MTSRSKPNKTTRKRQLSSARRKDSIDELMNLTDMTDPREIKVETRTVKAADEWKRLASRTA